MKKIKTEKEKLIKEFKSDVKEAVMDLKTKGRRHRQIPNILTLARIISPVIILPLAFLGKDVITLIVTAFFALTDCFDGLIARIFNLKSRLGQLLDTIADKEFVSILILVAAINRKYLLINLLLELIISIINVYSKLVGKDTSSTLTGKAKTWSLFILVGISITSTIFELSSLIPIAFYITIAFQVATIISYIIKYSKKK